MDTPLQRKLSRPFKISQDFLSWQEYYNILGNYLIIKEFCSTPPVSPKPGEIYLYVNAEHMKDWKADQWSWRDKGIRHIPNSEPRLTFHYYDTYYGSGFKKRAIQLFNKGAIYSGVTVLHYFGFLANVMHNPHGNRNKGRPKLS